MGRSADLPRTAGRFDGDDRGCHILHVDMDAFFASVEIKRRPELRGRPVVVGGGQRGVVAAASYEARRFGIRSAMSMSQALRRCPSAVVVPPDRAAYIEASGRVMAILRDVTPLVEPLSLDEAFLDVAAAQRIFGRPGRIAEQIRHRVDADLGLTCSVGIASTKFVAKLASARCKPDGMLVVPAERTLEFLRPLPVSALWGVGARTAESLQRLGVRTIADLAATPVDTVRRAVGTAAAEHITTLARGVDPRAVEPHGAEKSISSDRTLDEDLTVESDVRRELVRLSDEVGGRLRSKQLLARTVGIKIRFADFRTVTRARTLPVATDSSQVVFATAVELYRGLALDQPRVRLVGVRAEGLSPAASTPEQLTLDLTSAPPTASPIVSSTASPATSPTTSRAVSPAASAGISRAVDDARRRFGAAAVGSGTLLPRPAADAARGAADAARPGRSATPRAGLR